MRLGHLVFVVTASLVGFACATNSDDLVIATRPDQQGFTADDGGDAGNGADASPEATTTGGLCPTDECPAGWVTCPDSPFPCGVDFRTDNENCGACGNACPIINNLGVRSTCIDGTCRFGCTSQTADCNGLADDGCEVFVLSDKNNCGGCGIVCDDICTNGKCGCPYGQTFCGSYCTNLKTSGEDCGTCGNVCPPNTKPDPPEEWNAGYASCTGGQCNYQLACRDEWGDCNGDLGVEGGDGCERDILSDPDNCGSCGAKCAPGEACVYGKCECQCGGSCYHVTTDIDNCGACHSPCPGSRDENAHGAPVCDDGVCDYRCKVDWGDCDGLAGNGCEANLRSDPQNCGGCGIRCTGVEGQACVNGQCTMKDCGIR